VGSFAFKSSFSYQIFQFSCMGVVSSGSKIARNFVLVRGYRYLLLFTSISVANSRQIFLARLREKFGRRRKISVADFLYRGDLSESKVVFCGGNFGRVGNANVCYNCQDLAFLVRRNYILLIKTLLYICELPWLLITSVGIYCV
jgi:hypothetical protein